MFKALLKLHKFDPLAPFSLELDKRKQRQGSIYDYTPKIRLHSSTLSELETRDIVWQPFRELIDHLPLFQLRIERLIAPSVLLSLSEQNPRKAIEYVAELMKRNHTVVKLLNESAAKPRKA